MLRYRILDTDDKSEIETLARWYNDASIRHFSFPHGDASSYRRKILSENLRQKIRKKQAGKNYRMYFITWNGVPIGEMSVEIGGGQLLKHRPKSAWIGLIIGEKSARGQGLGARIMKKVESIAMEMGAQRIELGVFEFNVRAIRLYEKIGYKKFGRKEETTYWHGRLWGSLHMEKIL
jgi:RimJ/RimL family protein N-acetyltransferase